MTINVLNEWDDKTGRANVATGWQREDGNQLAGQDWQSIGWRDLRLISKGIVTTNWLERSRDQVAG